MEPGGWLLLVLSWSAIGGLVAFCVLRVLGRGS